jgi:hypothetical protein
MRVGEEITMVEQILPDLYRIEIPVPKSPLKALNAYLLKGRKRFLLIDTGWNQQECLSHGFPVAELRRAVENSPGFRYGPSVQLTSNSPGTMDLSYRENMRAELSYY